MQHPTKKCTICTQPKPLTEFRRQNEKPDGRRNVCKQCEKEQHRVKKEEQADYSKKYFDF